MRGWNHFLGRGCGFYCVVLPQAQQKSVQTHPVQTNRRTQVGKKIQQIEGASVNTGEVGTELFSKNQVISGNILTVEPQSSIIVEYMN